MAKCRNCGKEIVSLNRHCFPEDIEDEKTCCVCIPWQTLEKCFELSLDTAEKLLQDAEYLIADRRLDSAIALTIFSIEESGRALFAYDYLIQRKNVSKQSFKCEFKNHLAKMRRALKAIEKANPRFTDLENALWGDFAKELHSQRIESLFVKYSGKAQMWLPTSFSPPESLHQAYDFLDLEGSKEYRNAQGPIATLWIEKLTKYAKLVIHLARQQKNQIREP